jgi:asparagine synthase (glutamine-hydrolysing)
MCGIAGMYFNALPRPRDLDGPLERMLDALSHRGPDGQGRWGDDSAGIVLGHRRLAIIDLSPAGHQPMVSHDGRWVIAFNGEIYGHRDLRRRLEDLGATFVGTSDTEVLLEAVARWGVRETLDQVNGMYALALWDVRRQELWLARDPIGEKPLYVWDAPDRVVFASELGALRGADGFVPEIDADAVATYLQLGYVPAPLSIYEGVTKLEPGEWRRYRRSSCTSGRTNPRVDDPSLDPDHLFEVLSDAVAIRTIADVPVGVFLSGGIDSTLIAALAARAGTTHTFTATFGEASHDESIHAERVARALGTVHTPLPVAASDGLEVARRLPAIYGEPFGDPSAIPTHLIAAEARRSVGVALTGDGGDELFGGYNRLVRGARIDRLRRRVPGALRDPLASFAHRLDPTSVDRWGRRLSAAARRPPIPNLGDKLQKAASALGASATPSAILSLVAMWADPGSLVEHGRPLPLGIGGGSFDEELLALDRRLTLPEQMLTKVDRATMRVALEARPPLLDPRVVAVARRASIDQHVQGGTGKQLLRALLPRLIDPALLDRPKMGFDAPIGGWLRGPLRMWADELLAPDALRETGISGVEEVARRWKAHLAGSSSEEYRLWTLLQYQLWHRTEHQGRPVLEPVPAAVRAKSKGVELRRATADDQPAVHQLLAAAMDFDPDDARFSWLLRWKHVENPFGESPAWVAVSDGDIVGYRAFLRWRFIGHDRSWSAVRAVDTATHPEHQGKGIFRSLTLHALEELRSEGVDFVFNTPNDQSRPGYLKMGWQLIGQPMPWIRPAKVRSLPNIAQARTAAGYWGERSTAGTGAAEAFADDDAVASLVKASEIRDDRIRTERSPEYLRWRYPASNLGYRVITLGDDVAEGAACFRLRRRGASLEATVGDVLVPGNDPSGRRALLGEIARRSGADYVLMLGASVRDRFMPLIGQGPTLVWRHLCHTEKPAAEEWALSMGDIELF